MFKRKTKTPDLVLLLLLLLLIACAPKRDPISDRPVVVLTFDDAVKSQLTEVAPLLKSYGFNATFFVTYKWMKDTIHFLTWSDIKKIHDMGFEIGNHSWTHGDFSQPRKAFELEGELGLIEWMLRRNGIPKPVSYAHTGNTFGPEAIEALNRRGYMVARRGKQPEIPYGKLEGGPGYDPLSHHPLLIPTTIDFYPEMDMASFTKSLQQVPDYEIAVLQFHGVPDVVHPWVNTPPEQFKKYMDYLKEKDYEVIAMKDLEEFIPEHLPNDPLLTSRYTRKEGALEWPVEVVESREEMAFWINVMRRHHYTHEEMANVLGWSRDTIKSIKKSIVNDLTADPDRIEVLPFPGGRHPRIDFKEGMLSPRRGTKLSIFLPWEEQDYVVLDLPEAVSSQFGLTFLGHKHVPTIFDKELINITNIDWKKDKKGNWINLWELPNGISIGSKVIALKDRVRMKLWLTNHTQDTLFKELQTQVCIMLGKAAEFNRQTNQNKLLNCPIVSVESKFEDQWILTGWEGCSHPWGNEDCPCLHGDPKFPDCAPGETVRLNGVMWFYSGKELEGEIQRMKKEYTWL